MTDLISIIVPCYKSERFLDRLIGDVLAQTYAYWELLVVSNGEGQEPQLRIAHKYADNDLRIRILTSVRGGVSLARNIGLREAKGQWITFLDADDRIAPNHLQLYLDGMEMAGEKPDVVMGGFTLVRDGTSLQVPLEGKNGLLELLETTRSEIVNSVWNKLYSRKSVSNRFFNEGISFAEDKLFNLHVFQNAQHILTIPLSGYKYICLGENSAMSSFHHAIEEAFAETQKATNALYLSLGVKEEVIHEKETGNKFTLCYLFVSNLFRLGSPYSFWQKRNEIERLAFEDETVTASAKRYQWSELSLLMKIWMVCFKSRSSWFTTLTFTLLFWARRNMKTLYNKITPMLR